MAVKILIASILLIALSLFWVSLAGSTEVIFVKKTVSAHKIVIFSKSYCPYCRKAKTIFKELNQVPFVVEIDRRGDGSNIQDALSQIVGRRTVPQVFINGKHIGGAEETVKAYQNGSLAKLLGIELFQQAKDLNKISNSSKFKTPTCSRSCLKPSINKLLESNVEAYFAK